MNYEDRHTIELAIRPEVWHAFLELQRATMSSGLPPQLITEIFTVASVGSGCRHCQAHGAYGLSLQGVDEERIKQLWSFSESPLFTDSERSALRFALDAARAPSEVTPEHHAELRVHYSDEEIADILAVVCMAGWLNRWNDALATVTDQESVDWAHAHLQDVGWSLGKHAGTKEEQRIGHPATLRAQGKDPLSR